MITQKKLLPMNTKRFAIPVAALSVTLLFSFCKKEDKYDASTDSPMVAGLLPEEVDNYPNSGNDYLAALGRVIFYDKELSAKKNISCGSCHQQQYAFADAVPFSQGTNSEHAKRNTPQIFSRTGKVFWDGRANSMQEMVLMPVENDREMNITNIDLMIDRLNSIDYYKPLVKYAFRNDEKLTAHRIRAAVAEFMSNFSFTNSRFSA